MDLDILASHGLDIDAKYILVYKVPLNERASLFILDAGILDFDFIF
ncbi:MAG: hypothetical protein QXX95_04190 [Nitrososphaerales archaeon]